VFVQLQALVPAADATTNKAAAAQAGGGAKAQKRQKDAGRATTDQGSGGGNTPAASTQLTKLWFVRLAGRDDGGAFKVRTPHELPQDLALLPSLVK
jgi:hypothetical protein